MPSAHVSDSLPEVVHLDDLSTGASFVERALGAGGREDSGVAQSCCLCHALVDHRNTADVAGQRDFTDRCDVEWDGQVLAGGGDRKARGQVRAGVRESYSAHGCDEHVLVRELEPGNAFGDSDEHRHAR